MRLNCYAVAVVHNYLFDHTIIIDEVNAIVFECLKNASIRRVVELYMWQKFAEGNSRNFYRIFKLDEHFADGRIVEVLIC